MTGTRERRARGPAWLRAVLSHPWLMPATALLLRARTVRRSTAFLARELGARGGTFAYDLRSATTRVVVRHGSGDPVTLGEVFHERDYDPPPELGELEPELIVDLGANVGYFGAFALDAWPRARVVAYEPDPSNAAVHERAIAINGLADRWELRRAIAATRDGTLRFAASGDALSHVSEDGDLAVAAHDVLPLIAGADLVKLDVEGGEWEILSDPRFALRPPRVMVLEYHPHPDAGPSARGAALTHLRAAGLERTLSIFDRSDGYGMLWAWRP